MKNLVAAWLLCLCSSVASAESLPIGSVLEPGLRQVCLTQQSAHDIIAAYKASGAVARDQVYRQKRDCYYVRRISFTVLRVVEEVEISPHLTVTILELENWNRGIFYGFTTKNVN